MSLLRDWCKGFSLCALLREISHHEQQDNFLVDHLDDLDSLESADRSKSTWISTAETDPCLNPTDIMGNQAGVSNSNHPPSLELSTTTDYNFEPLSYSSYQVNEPGFPPFNPYISLPDARNHLTDPTPSSTLRSAPSNLLLSQAQNDQQGISGPTIQQTPPEKIPLLPEKTNFSCEVCSDKFALSWQLE